MNAEAIIVPTMRMTLLCTGLLVGGAAWSADYAANPVEGNSGGAPLAAAPTLLIDAELHAYLHDPAMHVPDNLGNYGENYRVLYPDHLATHDDRLPQLTSVK